MAAATRDRSEPVELVRSDLRGSWLLMAPVLIIGAVAAAAVHQRTVVGALTATLAAFAAGALLAAYWMAGRNAVFVDAQGMIVVARGRAVRVVDWGDVHEAHWRGGTFWTGWDPGCVVVTVGAQREPVWVGSIVIVDPATRVEVGERVDAVLAMYLPSRAAG